MGEKLNRIILVIFFGLVICYVSTIRSYASTHNSQACEYPEFPIVSDPICNKTVLLYEMVSEIELVDDEIVKFIDENSDEIDLNLAIDAFFKQTVLFPSCQRRRKQVVNYLISKNANVSHQDELGYSSLMSCAEKNYTEIMLMLLSQRADIIDDQDEDGLTALNYAARNDNRDAMLILINIGANVQPALIDEKVSKETKSFIVTTRRAYLWSRARSMVQNFLSIFTQSSQRKVEIEFDADV